jgi:DNA modification methylase
MMAQPSPARLLVGDMRERLRELPDDSVDAVVTDPPYHLTSIVKRFGSPTAAPMRNADEANDRNGPYRRTSRGFMGQTWDGGDVAFRAETWTEVLRVLKPGGHLVAFGGTRTYHRLAVAIEDAGFELRDLIAWVYGTGFPKNHDIGKRIDKSRTEDEAPTRDVCRFVRSAMDAQGLKSRDLSRFFGDCHPRLIDHWAARDSDSQPTLPTPEQWATLKRVLTLGDDLDAEVDRLNRRKGEPSDRWNGAEIVGEYDGEPGGFGDYRFSARDKSIRTPTDEAADWAGWGTALKPALEPVALARKPLSEKSVAANVVRWGTGAINVDACRIETDPSVAAKNPHTVSRSNGFGEERRGAAYDPTQGRYPANLCHDGSAEVLAGFPDAGGKWGEQGSHSDRRGMFNIGTGGGESFIGDSGSAARFFYCAKASTEERGEDNDHPTVKPVALLVWLIRLVTPEGGLVLDPFAGSGSVGIAAEIERRPFIGIELKPEYAAVAERRLRTSAGLFAQVSVG